MEFVQLSKDRGFVGIMVLIEGEVNALLLRQCFLRAAP